MHYNRHNWVLKTSFILFYLSLSFVLNLFLVPYRGTPLMVEQALASSLICAGISFYLMSLFEHFRSFRYSPRKSDLLIVTLFVAIAELIFIAGCRHIFHLETASVLGTLKKVLALSVAWHFLHSILALTLSKLNYRIQILFLGSPEELEKLQAQITASAYRHTFAFQRWHEASNYNPTDLLVFGPSCLQDDKMKYHLIQLTIAKMDVMDSRTLLEELENHVDLSLQSADDYLAWAQRLSPGTKIYLRLKAAVEPLLAAVVFALLLPIMILTAIAIKLSSEGPMFFRQKRLGIRGKTFEILKFRTMRVDAEANGAQWATSGDPRITPVGHLLRKLHLDEFPQLFNIMKGEVSFVGPRPERPEFYESLKQSIPLFHLRTVIRPGVTGWAQVWAGYAASEAESSTKLSYDLYYLKNIGLRMDLISLVLTLVHVTRKLLFAEKSLAPTGVQAEASILGLKEGIGR